MTKRRRVRRPQRRTPQPGPRQRTPQTSAQPNHETAAQLSDVEHILQLQRTIGNQATLRLLQRAAPTRRADPSDAATGPLNAGEATRDDVKTIAPEARTTLPEPLKAHADYYIASARAQFASWRAWRTTLDPQPRPIIEALARASQTLSDAAGSHKYALRSYLRQELGPSDLYSAREMCQFSVGAAFEIGELLGLDYNRTIHRYYLEMDEPEPLEMLTEARDEIIERVLGPLLERMKEQIDAYLSEDVQKLGQAAWEYVYQKLLEKLGEYVKGKLMERLAEKGLDKKLKKLQETLEALLVFRKGTVYYTNDIGMTYMRDFLIGGLAPPGLNLGTIGLPSDGAVSKEARSGDYWTPSDFSTAVLGGYMGATLDTPGIQADFLELRTLTFYSDGRSMQFEWHGEDLFNFEREPIDWEGLGKSLLEQVMDLVTDEAFKESAVEKAKESFIEFVKEAVSAEVGIGGMGGLSVPLGAAEVDVLDPELPPWLRKDGPLLERKIFFTTNSDVLDDQALQTITNLVYETREHYLQAQARGVPQITLHLDVTGRASPRYQHPGKDEDAAALNMALSQARAEATADALRREFGSLDLFNVVVNEPVAIGPDNAVVPLPLDESVDATGSQSANYKGETSNEAQDRRADITLRWEADVESDAIPDMPQRTMENLPDFLYEDDGSLDTEFVKPFLRSRKRP